MKCNVIIALKWVIALTSVQARRGEPPIIENLPVSHLQQLIETIRSKGTNKGSTNLPNPGPIKRELNTILMQKKEEGGHRQEILHYGGRCAVRGRRSTAGWERKPHYTQAPHADTSRCEDGMRSMIAIFKMKRGQI